MRFSVSEGIDLAEKKHDAFKGIALSLSSIDNPARKQLSFKRRICDHKVLLEQRCFTWLVCAAFAILKWKYLSRDTEWEWWAFFFLGENAGWQESFITRRRECCCTVSLPRLFTAFITLWQLTEEKVVDFKTPLNTVFRSSEKLNQQYIWDCNYPCVCVTFI